MALWRGGAAALRRCGAAVGLWRCGVVALRWRGSGAAVALLWRCRSVAAGGFSGCSRGSGSQPWHGVRGGEGGSLLLSLLIMLLSIFIIIIIILILIIRWVLVLNPRDRSLATARYWCPCLSLLLPLLLTSHPSPILLLLLFPQQLHQVISIISSRLWCW